MPIFQDPEQRFLKPDRPLASSHHSIPLKPKTSEDSIRTEFCDGPLPDPPSWNREGNQHGGQESDGPAQARAGVCTSDRNELMERIKRGESPTWVPSQTLQEEYSKIHREEPSFTSPSRSTHYEPNSLLASADFENTSSTANDRYVTDSELPFEIKRPGSALHAGDFTMDSHNATQASHQSDTSLESAELSAQGIIRASPAIPWSIPPQPQRHVDAFSSTQERYRTRGSGPIPWRNRAPSLGSLSSSYVAKAPTTPLVQQSNNTDLDFSPVDRPMSPSKINRRHTLPPRPSPSSQERIASNQLPLHAWDGGLGREPTNFDNEPSPYVGHIDLSQLPAPAESKKTRRSRSKSPPVDKGHSVHLKDETVTQSDQSTEDTCTGYKKRRRKSPPPSSLQGGYRIPQKGQLQIVIKNPNKTAVKLFLVPYELEDMPVGSKTFIRQRCFSKDPVIDGLSFEPKSGSSMSFGSTPPKRKPTLRYLIHVNICSPSSGRFYLYQHIRVVFANRVPDNKEQLQTETQTPQPCYSAYSTNLPLSRSISGSSAGFAREKAYRKSSSGFGVGDETVDDRHPQAFVSRTNYPFNYGAPLPPVPGIPCQFQSNQTSVQDSHFQTDVTYNIGKDRAAGSGEGSPFPIFGRLPACPTPAFPIMSIPTGRHRPWRNDAQVQRPAEDEVMDLDDCSRPTTSSSPSLHSPLSDKTNVHRLHRERSDLSHSSGENSPYSKLSRWDVGYGGRPSTPEPGAGLLTKKLRGLGVQMEAPGMRSEERDE
ncbi:MAG: hypothetical protein Q9178_004214 [Gyalolechia marmorata]